MAPTGQTRKTQRPVRDDSAGSPLERMLLKVVDGGLAGCIFVVPLLMGGRQALGQLALVTLAVTVALAWTLLLGLRRKAFWRFSSAEILLVAGIVVLLLQIAPLPQSALTWITPQSAERLPLWTAEGDSTATMGAWPCLSMTPAVTRAGLALFSAYALLFLVTLQRIETLGDVERLLRWIAVSAIIMAGFGLLQLLTSNGKFFWFYEHPFVDTLEEAKGSFTNKNHFAHFLALGVGPLIWWLQDRVRTRSRRGSRDFGGSGREFSSGHVFSGFRSVALGVVLFAGLLSLSRGGVSVMFLAVAISVAVCYRARTVGFRFVLSLGAVGLLIGALLTVEGFDRVSNRLDDLGSGSIDQIDHEGARRTIWAADLTASRDFALLGSGVGSHVEVSPMYLDEPEGPEYSHAENGPIQILLETGAVGLTLVMAGVGLCLFWCLGGLKNATDSRMTVCIGAIFASLMANLVHSMADFVWYVPACMALVAMLAACACRVYQMAAEAAGKPSRAVTLPRVAGWAMVPLVLGLGTWMIAGRFGPTLAEPHWDRYRIITMASQQSAAKGSEPQQQPTEAQDSESPFSGVDRVIEELRQVVRWNPHHARAHMRLAEAYLRRFDLAQADPSAANAMPLSQIRDAAIRARANADENETAAWISRVLGSHRERLDLALEHTRRSLALCPLQGEGYLHLAELSFLERTDSETDKAAYIDQALRVRAFDGVVLFEAGREAWLAGDWQRGLAHWKRSFLCGRVHQKRLIDLLAGRVPLSFILENFQPDVYALRFLHAHYRQFEETDPIELERFRRSYVQVLRTEAESLDGEEAAALWLEGRWVNDLLGEFDDAVVCGQNAMRYDPNNFDVRYGLGLSLIKQMDYAEAEKHISWCVQRRPNNPQLRDLMRQVVKQKIGADNGSTATAMKPEVLR
ncbi:MAG: O-antigen ligase family protein [Thermoguttaceae bacterium]